MKRKKSLQPDYAFWDTIHSFPEWQVTCLWSELEPSIELSSHAQPMAIQEKLTVARQDDRIGSEVRKSSSSGQTIYEIWYRRSDLLAYVSLNFEKPKFLFPDQRKISAASKKPQGQTSNSPIADHAVPIRDSQAVEAVNGKMEMHENTIIEGDKHISPSSPYLTVKQLSEKHPAFTQAALRNLIFKAKPGQSSKGVIPGNGLDIALVHVGSKVLFDEEEFLKWIKCHRY